MHYDIPGGPIGRRYVDMLSSEVQQLAADNYTADCLVVFSSLLLQRDKGVKKMAADVRRILERRMNLWESKDFELLYQEACWCNKSLRSSGGRKDDKANVVKVFTRLMLQGKVKAAVRWLSEKLRSGILSPLDVVEVSDSSSQKSVWEVLRSKHPESRPPSEDSLIKCDSLPKFEDVEINGGHVLKIARRIQGGTGPGGCNSRWSWTRWL